MTGIVKNLPINKNFGFIRAGGLEFFFHRDDYTGSWIELVSDFDKHKEIQVEFKSVESERGPRAAEVTRV